MGYGLCVDPESFEEWLFVQRDWGYCIASTSTSSASWSSRVSL